MDKQILHPDQEKILLLRKDDRTTLKHVYEDNFPHVSKMIRHNSGNEDDAKDIFQEAFADLLLKIKETDLVLTCSLRTFIITISRYKWLNELRRRKKTTAIDTFEHALYTDESVEIESNEKEQQIELMEASFRKLGEECKKLLQMFYYHKLSLDEIAETMGYTYAYAKNKKSRCIRKIKEIAGT